MMDQIEKKQILTAVKKHGSGTKNLNYETQKFHQADEPYKLYGGNRYYRSDRVVMLSNNYEKGYYNGDIGNVQDFDESGIEIKFADGRLVYLPNMEMIDMQLAYALTVHKSQGNEYEQVVIVLSNHGRRMMNRNLLYTAVTRAKDMQRRA